MSGDPKPHKRLETLETKPGSLDPRPSSGTEQFSLHHKSPGWHQRLLNLSHICKSKSLKVRTWSCEPVKEDVQNCLINHILKHCGFGEGWFLRGCVGQEWGNPSDVEQRSVIAVECEDKGSHCS